MTRGLTGAACVVALAAAPAGAHPGHGGAQIVVEGVQPAAKGVEVTDVPGAVGKLRLATTGSTEVVVLGSDGQAMLRVGRRGVEANVNSPDWYSVNEPLGIAQAPPSAKPSAPERWKLVSTEHAWEWFDHRFHPASGKPVYEWAIPLRVDGEKAEVRGHMAQLGGLYEIRPDPGKLPAGVTATGIGSPLPAIRLATTGGRQVRVLGPDGEEFARVGEQGAEVNVHSSLWIPTAQVRNQSLLDSVVDPSAKPTWIVANRAADLIYPDSRMIPGGREPGSGLGEVWRWSVPLLVGDRRVALTGSTVLVAEEVDTGPAPPLPTEAAAATTSEDGGGGSALPIAGGIAAVALLAGLAVFLLRRRRAVSRT